MARGDGKPVKRDGGRNRRRKDTLRLVRVQPAGRQGIQMVFDAGGEEHTWVLEQTSVVEFMALLLSGRMHGGRRVILDDVELTIEPPDKKGADPLLCMALGPLEVCGVIEPKTAKAMKNDLERALKRPN